MTEQEILEAFPRKSFTMKGKISTGDVWYSDIWLFVKTRKIEHQYNQIIDTLRKNNYYIHS
jgi:hypothetical protein